LQSETQESDLVGNPQRRQIGDSLLEPDKIQKVLWPRVLHSNARMNIFTISAPCQSLSWIEGRIFSLLQMISHEGFTSGSSVVGHLLTFGLVPAFCVHVKAERNCDE